jgi:hypothetical protein
LGSGGFHRRPDLVHSLSLIVFSYPERKKAEGPVPFPEGPLGFFTKSGFSRPRYPPSPSPSRTPMTPPAMVAVATLLAAMATKARNM